MSIQQETAKGSILPPGTSVGRAPDASERPKTFEVKKLDATTAHFSWRIPLKKLNKEVGKFHYSDEVPLADHRWRIGVVDKSTRSAGSGPPCVGVYVTYNTSESDPELHTAFTIIIVNQNPAKTKRVSGRQVFESGRGWGCPTHVTIEDAFSPEKGWIHKDADDADCLLIEAEVECRYHHFKIVTETDFRRYDERIGVHDGLYDLGTHPAVKFDEDTKWQDFKAAVAKRTGAFTNAQRFWRWNRAEGEDQRRPRTSVHETAADALLGDVFGLRKGDLASHLEPIELFVEQGPSPTALLPPLEDGSTLLFLRHYVPEKHSLKHIGHYLHQSKSLTLSEAKGFANTMLGGSPDAPLDVYQEMHTTSIKKRDWTKSAEEQELSHGHILIVQVPPDPNIPTRCPSDAGFFAFLAKQVKKEKLRKLREEERIERQLAEADTRGAALVRVKKDLVYAWAEAKDRRTRLKAASDRSARLEVELAAALAEAEDRRKRLEKAEGERDKRGAALARLKTEKASVRANLSDRGRQLKAAELALEERDLTMGKVSGELATARAEAKDLRRRLELFEGARKERGAALVQAKEDLAAARLEAQDRKMRIEAVEQALLEERRMQEIVVHVIDAEALERRRIAETATDIYLDNVVSFSRLMMVRGEKALQKSRGRLHYLILAVNVITMVLAVGIGAWYLPGVETTTTERMQETTRSGASIIASPPNASADPTADERPPQCAAAYLPAAEDGAGWRGGYSASGLLLIGVVAGAAVKRIADRF